MLNQIIAFVMSIFFAIPNLILSVGIKSPIEEVAKSDEKTPTTISEYFYYDDYGAMHSKLVDEDGNEVTVESNNKDDSHSKPNAVIPATYDSRKLGRVTSVKNQSSTGCCWAFSTCSMIESSLISQGYETKTSVNLSAGHLAWFTNRSHITDDKSDQIAYEGLDILEPFKRGGSWLIAGFELATWSGSAKTSEFPFNATDTSQMEFDESKRYVSDYHLTSILDYGNSSRDEIKQAVIDNGSVCSSIYYADSNLRFSSLGYCYNQSIVTGTNHAVTIVGWNDNFPASNFSTQPSENGAWLVKNSWGTNWGTVGYFWLSYFDASLSSYGVLTAVPAENDSTHNYQYDGFGAFSYLNYGTDTIYGSNIFTANGDELIKGVGYYTAFDDVSCTVSVYTDVTNTAKPTSGTLVESRVVYNKRGGYHTLPLNNEYEITAGEKFSVVVKYSSSIGVAYVPIEGSTLAIYSDGTEAYYTSSLGQSFISYNGSNWTDSSGIGYNNTPIKAFTVDKPMKFELKDSATVNIDDNNILLGIYPNEMEFAELIDMFKENGTITFDSDELYTGNKLYLNDSKGDVRDTVTIVVFGDTSGDGNADGMDAFIISAIIFGMLNSENTNPEVLRAADYNSDGKVDETDYDIVSELGVHP